jgi:hypothetical protein
MREIDIHCLLTALVSVDEESCMRLEIRQPDAENAYTWLSLAEVERLHALCGRWIEAIRSAQSERCQIESDFTEAE